jgi:2-oxoglutarate dehydrogenase E2 component (dihydrolipoamide succinyltransferase)
MSIEVKIPAVGESITSGVVSVWHKKSGDYVETGDPLFTLETDKVSSEIVAEAAGVLATKVDEGQEVKIGEVVATIDDAAAPPGKRADAPGEAKPTPSAAAKKESPGKRSPNADVLSPAVRRVVEEEQIDPKKVGGTGKDGRLTKGDVVAYKEQKVSVGGQETSQSPATEQSGSASDNNRVTRKKMSPLRRKIAAQLVMAQHTAAILTTFNECDMTEVQALRAKSQDAFTKKHGVKLGFMSFFIKATVEGLKAVPPINGRIEGDDFIQNNYYDIGVAVGTERGLVVPVVRNADKKSFADIERDISDYATKAREGKIKIEELQGGTFTISNGGVYGSLFGTPILNPPQSGILGMHTIQKRPVVIKDEVVVRPMMYLAFSYDHRAVDGKEAVTFLVTVKQCIEDPKKLPLDF